MKETCFSVLTQENKIISQSDISLTGKIISINNYAKAASQQSVKLDLTKILPSVHICCG